MVTLDQKRSQELEETKAIPSEPPADASEDERRAFERFEGDFYRDFLEGRKHWLEPLSPEIEHYDLFAEAPGMFLDFANIRTSLAGVKKFADRFGSLEFDQIWYIEEWYQHIRQLRHAVQAWEKAKVSGNFRRLTDLIEQRAVVGPTAAGLKGIPVGIGLVTNKSGAFSGIGIRPQAFADALWIQLTLAIEGNKTYEACVECGTWFPLSGSDFRSDKRYCSDACRMRAYRKRKSARLS